MSKQNFVEITTCRSCGSGNLLPFYSTPPVPIAGIYYTDGAPTVDVRAPMTLVCCPACTLTQLQETIGHEIYENYSFVGDSAASYQAHLERVAGLLAGEWGITGKRIFEVGASNGVLLRILADNHRNEVSGIEPSSKLCAAAAANGIAIRNGYFNNRFLDAESVGTFDCVIIRHVLEHIDDLDDMLRALRRVVREDGILVVEVPDGDKIFSNNLFSNIFHEHLNYFTHASLQHLLARHGFSLQYEEKVDIHGGSLFLVCRPDYDATVSLPYVDQAVLNRFSAQAAHYYAALKKKVVTLRGQGKTVHGYGASHRTFILLGIADVDRDELPVIYDNNPMLHGKRLNGLHNKVLPKEAVSVDNPDALLIFATSYEEEITAYLVNECHYHGEIISIRYEALCGHD